MKERYVSSTINNFTYTKLSAATRLSRESLKKRIQTLKEMELVEFVGIFNSIKAKESTSAEWFGGDTEASAADLTAALKGGDGNDNM